MEKIQKKVEHYIEAYHMLDGVENVVAGVSGGADSMCMLNILLQLRERYGYHLTVVHIHHGIRGQSADEDMEYVEKFCGEKKIEFFGFHYKVEELAKVWHMSDEEAGRKIRYEAFGLGGIQFRPDYCAKGRFVLRAEPRGLRANCE